MPRSPVGSSLDGATMRRNTDSVVVLLALTVLSMIRCSPSGRAPGGGSTSELGSSREHLISKLEHEIPRLMEAAVVPGLSVGLIQDGELAWFGSFGVKNVTTGEPVTDETLFEAASTGKPVFAYAVLKLVERGELNLDTPLVHYTPLSYLGEIWSGYDIDDERMLRVTPRMVLSHSAGFPNWPGERQEILFEPGEQWGYSGSGFVTLGEAVKKVTGLPLDEIVRREVFEPLGMTGSRFVWSDDLRGRVSYRHTGVARPRPMHRYLEPMAAGSLYTNARDYAGFLLGIVNNGDLAGSIVAEMLTPQIRVTSEEDGGVSWGLGLALNHTDRGTSIWHWGDNGDTKAYFEVLIEEKTGLVFFANGHNGLSIAAELLDVAIGLTSPGVAKEPLAAKTTDSPKVRLCHAYARGGAQEAAALLESFGGDREIAASLSPDVLVYLAREAMSLEDVAGAIEILKPAAEVYPSSAAIQAVLAETFLRSGDRRRALQHYRRAVQMDPALTRSLQALASLEAQVH